MDPETTPNQPYQLTPEEMQLQERAKKTQQVQQFLQLITSGLTKIYRDIMMMILKR